MRAVIFANGELKGQDTVKSLLRPDDLIGAADGGANHCHDLGLTPDVLIGDLDSIREVDFQFWQDAGMEIIMHDPDKDENDLELTLLYALEKGIEEVLILGGLGLRWDQSIANILLPANEKLCGLEVSFWDNGTYIYLIKDEIRIRGEEGNTVSLIPIRGDVEGVTTRGLAWALKDEPLYFGETRGVSNIMVQDEAVVTVREGLLLCVVGSIEN